MRPGDGRDDRQAQPGPVRRARALSGARSVGTADAYDSARREELDGAAREFLEEALLTTYRMNAPDTVAPAATTGYLRSTLVQRSGTGRVT